jgi:hypothetical protein
VQAPHAAPFVPQTASDKRVTHVPFGSQQPVGQVAAVHLSAQVAAVQLWAALHALHAAPCLPQ